MKNSLLNLLVVLILGTLISTQSFAQLTGTKTIPGDYATIALAVTDLNTQGVGTGGVTFNVAAGYTESITTPILITATGTLSNPVVFQKSGAGTNPIITRTDAGTNATSTLGGQGDAVIIIQGSDYLTFDAINVVSSNAGIEYGYYLRKAGVTDGCKYVTVKNASITMTKGTSAYVVGIYSSNNDASSLVSSATGITLTGTGGRNENITITGNTIGSVFTGILVRGYGASSPWDLYDQNITIGASGAGNTISNYAGNAASTAYAVYMIYQTSPTVSYNTISNAGGGGVSATSTLYGIMLSTSSLGGDLVASNNSITLAQGSTSGAQCIYASSTCSSITISNNTFSYGAFASTSTSYLIYCSNSTNNLTVTGNQSSGTITKTGAGELDGYYNFGSPTGGTANISNNNFSNITLTGASTFYGIKHYTSTTQAMNLNNNTISNITGGSSAVYGVYQGYGASGTNVNGNSVTNMTSSAAVYGIYLGASTAPVSLTASGNTVSGLSSTGAVSVYGIYNNLGTANSIKNNNVFNLAASNSGGSVYGIYIGGGTTTNIYNNFISDLRTPAANAAIPLAGIYASGGTTDNIFDNTVYLNAVSSGALFGSAAVYASTTPTVDLRNNILVNVSIPTGATGFTSAYRRSSTTLTSYASTSNNNDFYAGTPGANNLIYYDGTNSDQTLAAFKTRVSPRDAASISENAPFINVGTSPYNLHLSASVATQCESGGVRITTPVAITDDIDGNLRYGETGYTGTGAAPDLGADEGNFILLDLTPPAFTYTALGNTSSLLGRTITVTITDASAVGTGANQPVMYWAINSGTYTGPVAPTTIAGNQYTFSLGTGVILGDVVKYYFVAQDQATTPNVGSAPSGATVTANPPISTSAPATPESYTIVGCISGTKSVGTGGDYATLTAAFTAINNSELCGPMTLVLTDATYTTETLPLVLNSNSGASATNTLTIKPASGVTASISGASASGTVIKILNRYTTIDGSNSGGTTRDLTIANTSATSPNVLQLCSTGTTPLSGVCVKNTIIVNGANTGSALIISDAGGTAGYFNNLTIQNNSIQQAYIGIYALAAVSPGNGNGLLITGNDLNSSGANSIRLVGVYVQGVDGATISNNQIGNMANANAESPKGIWIATGTNSASISGNTISNLTLTNTGAYAISGIYVNPGTTATNISISNNTISTLSNSGTSLSFAAILTFSPNTSITNNTVSGLTQLGAAAFWGIVQSGAVNSSCSGNTVSGLLTATTGTASGINIQGASTGVNVFNNKVSNIKNTNTGGYGSNGLMLSSSSSTANITLYNNFIYDIAAYGYAGATAVDNGYGIIISSGGGYNIYHNSVLMNTSQTVDGYPAAMNIGSSVTTASSIDMRDNIFANTQTVGTNRYAIYSAASASVFANSNYNNYYTTGPNIGYLGANAADLIAWQTATGKDANSVTGDPLFLSSTDLHLNTALNSPAKNAGVTIAGTGIDIDGETRNNPPDIGADDYSLVPTVVTSVGAGLTSTGIQLNGFVTANNESVGVTFQYGTTLAFGTIVNATPSPVTGNSPTSVSSLLTGLIPNTTYYFQAVGTVGAFVYNGIPALSFTTEAIPATVTTDPASSVTSTGATMNGTVNANNASTVVSFEYGMTTAYGTTVTALPGTVTGLTATAVSYTLTGLLPNTTYHYRVVGVNIAGTANGLDLTFTTPAILPTVVTNAATLVTGVSAMLNGTVNANNAITAVTFEYGLTTAYGATVTATPSSATGTSATSESYSVAGLEPNTTYHFRAIGVNSAGTAYGTDQSFTTSALAPTVVTLAATPIGSTTATLNGTVNANNQTSTVTFEYGLTTSYGTTVSSVPASVTGYSSTNVSAAISGLSLATTYHYRVKAVNATGTTYGSDLTFTTGCVTPAAAGSITGPASVCQSSSGAAYSVAAITGATSYIWTLPTGASIATGSGTNSITVNFSGSATSGNISVYGSSGCASGVSSSSAITVVARPTPVITGPASVCINSTGNVYSTSSGMSGYTWLVSAGGTITAGNGTNSITVTWNTTGAQTVSVNYSNAGSCNALSPTVYNVTVNPLPVPVITGQAAACESSTGNVYSTATGMTGYTWSISSGGVITAGAGTNSVSVTWNTVGAQTISVNYTNSNGCTAVSPTVKNVTINPLPVPGISGPGSVCAGTTGITYTTESGMTGYNWTVSAGGTITAGAATNTITVTWSTVGSKTVTVNYINSNSCSAAIPSTKAVTVNPLPVPTITGPTTVCTGSAPVTYSTETGMTGYTWTVSSGGTITAGAGTNAITVTWGTSGAKTVSANYTNPNGCQASTASTLNVTVNPAPSPTIAGLNEVCTGASGITYTTESGFSNYIWTVSYDGMITSGMNTSSITVDWGTAGLRTVMVNYSNGFGCPAVLPATYNVTVLSGPDPVISGDDNVCEGTTGLVYTTQSNYSGYVWTVSSGGTITSGVGTNSIHVNWNSAGAQTVSVNYTNSAGCEAMAPTVFNVAVDPKPAAAGVVTGTAVVCAGSQGIEYSVEAVANATSYNWTLPAGASIASGSNTNSITVNFPATASTGVVKVNGVNDCGSGASSPNFIVTIQAIPATPVITQHGDTLFSSASAGNQWYLEGVEIPGATDYYYVAVYSGNYTVVVTTNGCSSAVSNSLLVLPVSIGELAFGRSFEVYPNPNNGVFDLKAQSSKRIECSIEVYNSLGVLIHKQENVVIDGNFTRHLDLKGTTAGTYMVFMRNSDNSAMRKVIITR